MADGTEKWRTGPRGTVTFSDPTAQDRRGVIRQGIRNSATTGVTMVRSWPMVSTETLLDLGIIKVDQETVLSPRTGDSLKFHVYHFPDWAQVVPLTRDGHLVMIRQYRHGTKTIGIEIPGGMIDPEDATPMDAARRELAEETGYGGGDMIRLGDLRPQPALLSNRAVFFVAKDVENHSEQELDAGEDIEVILVRPAEIGPMIRDGRIHNAMTVTALMLAWWSNHLPTM